MIAAVLLWLSGTCGYSLRFFSTFYRFMPIVSLVKEGVTSHSLWFVSPHETRSHVRCSCLLIPSAYHLTRNLTLPLLVPRFIPPLQSRQVPIPAVRHVPVYTHTNVIYSSLQNTSILGTCSVSKIICTNTSPVGSSAPAHFSLFALVILIRMWLMAPAAPDPREVAWSASQIPATGTQCVTLDEQECW